MILVVCYEELIKNNEALFTLRRKFGGTLFEPFKCGYS